MYRQHLHTPLEVHTLASEVSGVFRNGYVDKAVLHDEYWAEELRRFRDGGRKRGGSANTDTPLARLSVLPSAISLSTSHGVGVGTGWYIPEDLFHIFVPFTDSRTNDFDDLTNSLGLTCVLFWSFFHSPI